jgi:hypothetical protein
MGMLGTVCLCLTYLLLTGGQAAATGDPSPQPFRLIFEGARTKDTGAANIRHEGAFAATAPVCGAGWGSDQEYFFPSGAVRENACSDGSGSFTTIVEPILAERGGAGTWRIVGGTGRYRDLRGQGTFTGELVTGSPSDQRSVTFRSTWNGVVGFDTMAPTVRVVVRTATRVRRTADHYRLRIAFETWDDRPTNAVAYRVLVTSGSSLVSFAEGRAKAGTTTVALRLRARRPDLPLIVEIRVRDPLGNERRALRAVPLPG